MSRKSNRALRASRKTGGPRTAAGKTNVSRNALRHGLAAVKHQRVAPTAEVGACALALCEGDDDAELYQAGVVVAEHQLALRAIREQKLAVVERLRDPTAIALRKGDNSRILAKARFMEAWLAHHDIEQTVPKLLEKYKDQMLPDRRPREAPKSVPPEAPKSRPRRRRKTASMLKDLSWLRDIRALRDIPPVRYDPLPWLDQDHDDPVPIRLKALLLEEIPPEQEAAAREIASKHVDGQQRKAWEALEEAIPDLLRLDRYERRIWSLLEKAMRNFMNIQMLRKFGEPNFSATHCP
jgi:hypothetical protein